MSVFDDPVGAAKSKAKEISSDIDSSLNYRATRPFVEKDDLKRNVDLPEKVMWGTLAGLAGVASTLMIPKSMIPKGLIKYRIPAALITGAGLSSIGYNTPDTVRAIAEEKYGKKPRGEALQEVKSIRRKSIEAADETENLINAYQNFSLKKEAFAAPIAKGALNFLRRAASTTAKTSGSALWKGYFPRSGLARGAKIPFGRKVLSKTVRWGTVGGLGYGGYKLNKRLGAPRSGANYTTLLRNNILSGHINPDELGQQDLKSVKLLGMR